MYRESGIHVRGLWSGIQNQSYKMKGRRIEDSGSESRVRARNGNMVRGRVREPESGIQWRDPRSGF